MSKVILGQSGALPHEPSAALYLNDKLVAAAKEEHFLRYKYTKNHLYPDCPEGAGA
jgi:carbamoyltransferase